MAPKRTKVSDGSNFDFAQWFKGTSLNSSSKKMLKDNGLQEREALLLLTPNDVEALLLPMGQQLYLRRALAKLGNGAFPSSEPEIAQ